MKLSATWHLDCRRLGHKVLVYDEVDSTNTQAALLAEDVRNDGVVIMAHAQTAGRGQHGRSWSCTPERGVLLSVLLFPPLPLRRPALLTAWAAVSVCETILDCTGLQAKIKWPNDVLIHGRKVCGILIEQGQATVAGIGLNVKQPAADFAAADLPHAVSLEMAARCTLDLETVAQTLIQKLDAEYDRLWKGDLTTLEACWKWRLGLLGKQVNLECNDRSHQGRLLEIAWTGLELRLPNGKTMRFSPETVRHIEEVTR